MIPGTSKIWSKSGPGDLLIITKMLQKTQAKYGIILETYYFCQYVTHKISKIFEICMSDVPVFLDCSDFVPFVRRIFLWFFEYIFLKYFYEDED